MNVNEVLLGIIRALTIILLAFFILAAYNGYLMIKDLQTTMHTRLANDEFPLPTGGINFPGVGSEQTQASDTGQTGTQQIDLMQISDPAIRTAFQKAVEAFQSNDQAEGLRQLDQLDVLLANKKMNIAQAKNQQLISAVQQNDSKAGQYVKELYQLLIQK